MVAAAAASVVAVVVVVLINGEGANVSDSSSCGKNKRGSTRSITSTAADNATDMAFFSTNSSHINIINESQKHKCLNITFKILAIA